MATNNNNFTNTTNTMKKFLLFLFIAFAFGIFCDFIFHKINKTDFTDNSIRGKIENEYKRKQDSLNNLIKEIDKKFNSVDKRFSKLDSVLNTSDKEIQNEKKQIIPYYKSNNLQRLYDSIDRRAGYIK